MLNKCRKTFFFFRSCTNTHYCTIIIKKRKLEKNFNTTLKFIFYYFYYTTTYQFSQNNVYFLQNLQCLYEFCWQNNNNVEFLSLYNTFYLKLNNKYVKMYTRSIKIILLVTTIFGFMSSSNYIYIYFFYIFLFSSYQ